jgi:hypothetical protein
LAIFQRLKIIPGGALEMVSLLTLQEVLHKIQGEQEGSQNMGVYHDNTPMQRIYGAGGLA